MILFLLFYIVAIALVAFSYLSERNVFQNVVQFFLILWLSVLPGFRALSVGTDTQNYYDLILGRFDYSKLISFGVEPGFSLFIVIVNKLHLEEYSFFILSIIFNFFFVKSIFRYKDNKVVMIVSFLTYSMLYFSSFNIVRQAIAVSIFIFALSYLKNKQYIIYSIYGFLALMFHYSAIFVFFFMFISFFSKIRKIMFLFAFIFPFFYNFFVDQLLNYYSGITDSDKSTIYQNASQQLGGRFFVLVNILVVFICFLVLRKREDAFLEVSLLLFMISMWVNISFLGLLYEGPGRLVVYSYAALILVWPKFINQFKNDQRPALTFMVSIFMISFFLINIMISNAHQVFPYFFI